MKPRKHKHKESFSILLISNTGQNSRQFHVSHTFMRLCMIFGIVLCISFGWLIYQCWFVPENRVAVGIASEKQQSTDESEIQEELLEKLSAQEKMVAQLEEEKENLNRQNEALTSENKALLAAAKGNMETDTVQQEQNAEEDTAFPSKYPYSEQGNVATKYSEDHPYVSIDTEGTGNIIAAGDGTVSEVGSDETYPLIIEIEHGNGYQTRYMFLQEAEALQEEGAQVRSGAAIAAVSVHNAQVDYQVIFEGQAIDPLIVFEAKG